MNNLYFNEARRFLLARIPEWAARPQPFKLTVAATYRCNHRCRICKVWKAPAQSNDELTPDDYEKVFHELRNSLLYLDWGGGEPFLRPDMAAIIRSSAKICPRLSAYVFSTNGLLTGRIAATIEEIAAALPKNRISVGVSLDGDETKHDYIRGTPGAFRAATSTLAQLKQLGKKTSQYRGQNRLHVLFA